MIFQCFRKDKNKILKENLLFTFQEELWLMRKENQIIQNQTNNPINSFNESKNKKQTNESSQCKWKMFFRTTKQKRKHQALDSLPITGSQPIRQTQLQKSERMKLPIRAKKWKSSYQGQERPRNPKSVQASKLQQEMHKSMIQ